MCISGVGFLLITALITDLDVCQVDRNIFPQVRDGLAGKMAWL